LYSIIGDGVAVTNPKQMEVTKNDRQQEEMGKTGTYNSGAEQSGGGGVYRPCR
jgi:hypothetical protein